MELIEIYLPWALVLCAQLNSLRFGNIGLERTKWLVKGVTKGIGDYGNAFGIPIVGGEVFFDDCYNTNPLVNLFSSWNYENWRYDIKTLQKELETQYLL